MTVADFQKALNKGQGRAMLYVMRWGDKDPAVKAILEEACFKTYAYDAQCEGSRSRWIYEIFSKTGNIDHYRSLILTKIDELEGFWSTAHLLGLLKLSSIDGCHESKKAIYRFFESSELNESWVGGSEIIELDGLEGFKRVARRLGEKLGLIEGHWEDEALFVRVIEMVGEDEVKKSLEEWALEDVDIARYRTEILRRHEASKEDELRYQNEGNRPRAIRSRPELSLEAVIAKIETAEDQYPSALMHYGKGASEEEIGTIISRMEKEPRIEQLIRYAWVFRRRYKKEPEAMPKRAITRFLELLEYKDEKLSVALSYTLAQASADEVRKAGLKWLLEDVQKPFESPIELMHNSAEIEDLEVIVSYSDRLPVALDSDENHSVYMGMLRIGERFEANQKTLPLLSRIYDRSPCSICRREAFEILNRSELIPKRIAQEQLFDCTRFKDW